MSPTSTQEPPRKPFSSKWMLPAKEREAAGAADGVLGSQTIDTDGDGVADTLALRVEAARASRMSRFGTFVTRFAVVLILTVSVGVAAAAATALYYTRADLDRTEQRLAESRRDAAGLRKDAGSERQELADLRGELVTAERKAAEAEAANKDLELNMRALRYLLANEGRAAGA